MNYLLFYEDKLGKRMLKLNNVVKHEISESQNQSVLIIDIPHNSEHILIQILYYTPILYLVKGQPANMT